MESMEAAAFEEALSVLSRHISPVNARSILLRVLKQEGLERSRFTRNDLIRCANNLRRGIQLFVGEDRRGAALQDINALCGNEATKVEAAVLRIAEESDIARARAETRKICDMLGASPFAMQKVATVVSELTRNMILYANGGLLTITPVITGRKLVEVSTSDQGPGIPKSKMDEIMAGRYKSRTGLGRGLLGTKQLADSFSIASDATGTRVMAGIWVEK
jgi:serine/threonine-protein kinase RsbT